MLKAVPNERNRIRFRELFLLQRDEQAPRAFAREAGLLYVQVPSNSGGRLRVRLGDTDADDTELEVVGPNGERARTTAKKGRELFIDLAPGKVKDGICTIDVNAPSGDFHVHALYEEVGFAREKNGKPLIPWNFWFFPFGAEHQPNAWDGTALRPLHKYAEATGTDEALDWEVVVHGGPPGTREEWEGHCDAAAPASVLFQAPKTKGKKWHGLAFTCEELKFFAAECTARYGRFDLGALGQHESEEGKFFMWPENVWWLHPEEETTEHPRGRSGWRHLKKPNQLPKKFGPYLAWLLEFLDNRMKGAGHALVMDLRSRTKQMSDAAAKEVWNHAVYRYRVVYWQWLGTPDQPIPDLRSVQVRLTLNANEDAIEKSNGYACTGHPADAKKVDGQTVPVPNGEGRDLVLEGRVQFRASGSIDRLSSFNAWFGVHPPKADGSPLTEEKRYPPRSALFLAKPVKHPTYGNVPMVGNPGVKRGDALQLMRLRKRYR